MKTLICKFISAAALILTLSAVGFAQTTAFNYQGRLNDGAAAANGTYEMQFALYDAAAGGAQIGSTVTNNSVTVTNGVFTVSLDFGASPFTAGANRWLDIGVRKASDPPGFTSLTPRQQMSSSPYSVRTISAASADSLSTACVGCVTNAQINSLSGNKITGAVTNATTATNVSGVIPVTNGGTNATTAIQARTNLGIPTITGTQNFIPKFNSFGGTSMGNSLIQDNGTGIGVNIAPAVQYLGYFSRQQLTENGDGQHTLFGYRTRNAQNDGTGYGQMTTNSATSGFNFWGDLYTFGVAGHSYNDFTRTGGVLGADVGGTYWGALGYRSSGSLNYGVFGSSAYAAGGGLTSEKQGIGGGFYGGMIGSWSRGGVMGQVTSGELFASYNLGNVFTSGFSADMVSLGNGANAQRVPAFAVTSPALKVYDDGTAQLNGESVFVPFDSSYANLLSGLPNVTVTAVGSPAQLYIKSIEVNGFTVAVASGTANVKFSWIAVGSRADANKASALPTEIFNGGFDTQIRDVMFNEGNKEDAGKSIWWDGSKVRFDKAPESVKPPKEELKPNK